MQRKISTKAIVEGALLLGILVILSILTYVPPFSLFSFILLPTPILFAVFRHNLKVATMIGFLSVITLIIVGIDPISSLINGIYASFIGLALGYGFVKKLKPTMTLIITTASLLTAILLIAFLYTTFLEYNIVEEILDLQVQLLESIAERIQETRPPVEEQGDRELFIALTREEIRYIFPGLLVLAATINSFFTIGLTRIILKKFKIETQPFPKFSHWRFGDWLIWTFVAAQLLPIFLPQTKQIAYNVTQVALYGIILQGLAVIYYKISEKIRYAAIKVIIILIILFIPILQSIAMFIGIIDFFWNFRRI
ncbi:DUF2232 domain-containing protein [Alkalicella caledoniensis]|uniref:DUF2232 domain-containing protein n=1 Tax=Alkalicella caledoniensis TaxID=2731377 RepID=A0A7G9W8L7_ALKCA|nr:DUF2232 domain-containing protein [Alkalicella caledoniensis]QNO15029.1 DUF2232 domain-containing protein [Alkalicella caledoniensis]